MYGTARYTYRTSSGNRFLFYFHCSLRSLFHVIVYNFTWLRSVKKTSLVINRHTNFAKKGELDMAVDVTSNIVQGFYVSSRYTDLFEVTSNLLGTGIYQEDT